MQGSAASQGVPPAGDTAWRILGLAAPIIVVSFAVLGWFVQHLLAEARSAGDARERAKLGLPSDSYSLIGAQPALVLALLAGVAFVTSVSWLGIYVGLFRTDLLSFGRLDATTLLFLFSLGGPSLVAIVILVGLRGAIAAMFVWVSRRISLKLPRCV